MVGTLLGLDRHLQEQSTSGNSAQYIAMNPDFGTSTTENGTTKAFKIEPEHPEETTHMPQLWSDEHDSGIRKDEGERM